MKIKFTVNVYRDDDGYVARAEELPVSGNGRTQRDAIQKLTSALGEQLEHAAHNRTLDALLDQAGFRGAIQVGRDTVLHVNLYKTDEEIVLPVPKKDR